MTSCSWRLLVAAIGLGGAAVGGAAPNSLGMELVEIPAGTYRRGSADGKWDEQPAHQVTISRPFLISRLEVTRRQFLQFRPDHKSPLTAKAIGVTWDDAVAFCAWLSEREGKPYRLPTEAEWEYACRLEGAADGGRLAGMLDDVVEWCQDWYGEYRPEDQTDPTGPDRGLVRVLRGDKLDVDDRVILPIGYNRPANRAGLPPAYGLPLVEANLSFRVVQAPPVPTPPYPAETRYFATGVRQSTTAAAARYRPDPARPYFRKRHLVPTPPESWEGNVYEDASHQRRMTALGLHPGLGGHQHSGALEVLPNGDLLFVAYTCWTEYNPEVGLLATRLRLGREEWEMPDFGFDVPGANDHAPLLWTDGGRTHLFWGLPKLPGRPPFQWVTTEDSGATWGPVRYPRFTTPFGASDAQPINTAFRDRDGVVYVAVDGANSDSILWTSADDLRTWQDRRGRAHGGHTTFALLSDGRSIIGLNGRKDQIDHYMTASISRDGARSFTREKTPFSWGGSNQRSSLLRLRSGRLIFVTDNRNSVEPSPAEWRDRPGCTVGISEDDGRTWRLKPLIGVQKHETRDMFTVGYSVLRQGADDLIHLVTTMNRPCLHLTFNEAWLLSDGQWPEDDAALMANSAHRVDAVEEHTERHPGGQVRLRWSAGVGDDGRYLQHGPERWYYPDGMLQYEASFTRGEKTGREVLYAPGGGKVWERDHQPGGVSTWTQYWPDGKPKAQSSWRRLHAHGTARRWDPAGRLVSEVEFRDGLADVK
ncbi:MAG: SUMF1/EgtB/PvdO family nonheme iron enzyme [Opitutaceae bacterium]|nr:SUMF1/EgtB/PvdO family nonheme iron enzyme [Opitutaceae bacterium]